MDFRPVSGDSPSRSHADKDLSLNNPAPPEAEFSQGSVIHQYLLVPTGVSKITELTLDQLKNNYRLFAKKLVNVDSDLVIRLILLKNNVVFFITIPSQFLVQTMYIMQLLYPPVRCVLYF